MQRPRSENRASNCRCTSEVFFLFFRFFLPCKYNVARAVCVCGGGVCVCVGGGSQSGVSARSANHTFRGQMWLVTVTPGAKPP